MSTKDYKYVSVFASEFSAYIALRESQGRKISDYQRYCRFLDQYLFMEGISKKELSATIVEGWLGSLWSDMSTRTRAVYLSHYSGFAKYLHTLGFAAFIPEGVITDKSYLPYLFSDDEVSRFFHAADNLSTGCTYFSNFAFPLVMRILYGCGLRVNEALCLELRDIDLESGILLIRNAKGNRDRLVPMDDSLTGILSRYLSFHRKNRKKEELLFQDHKGNKVPRWMMRYRFNRTLKLAGIEKPELPLYRRNICLNCMRHCFAVNSFRKQDLAGTDMYSCAPLLSTYMGHKKMDCTETYLHMTAENSRDIIDKASQYSKGLFPEVPR